jgi:hypothetical protein
MANNLLTPILNASTVSVNFFNGRLFSAEDINVEKKANIIAHSLLGQAIGSGIAYGLEVGISIASNTVVTPVLSVKQGLAINRSGTALLLEKDTEISLIRPATTPATSGSMVNSFQVCTPVQPGIYVAGAGVYLLLVCPASGSQGLAEVVGISTAAAACNTKYQVDGVQFRLVQLSLNQTELGDANHLRNLVAYKCFGRADWSQEVTDPFGAPPQTFGLIDQLRAAKQITDCEIPLAVMYWTATSGLVWVDMWAVRRMIVPKPAAQMWSPLVSPRRYSDGAAMLLQFQAELSSLLSGLSQSQMAALQLANTFGYLPSVGLLPVLNPKSPGINLDTFLGAIPHRQPEFADDSSFYSLIREALSVAPLEVASGEMLWLYKGWQSEKAIADGADAQSFVLFAGPFAPYIATPRLDVARWDYSNYPSCSGCEI